MIFLYLNKDLSLQNWKNAIHHVRDVKKSYSMLKDNLYHIVEENKIDDNQYNFQISLISECPIYNVHFPGYLLRRVPVLLKLQKN
jgi:hypothetical protein